MIRLYAPKIEDLWFREKILSDEKTMSYNRSWGGIIPFPQYQWKQWYSQWIANKDNRYFYRYIQKDDKFVGEVAYRFDDKRDIYVASFRSMIILSGCWRNGISRIINTFSRIAISWVIL